MCHAQTFGNLRFFSPFLFIPSQYQVCGAGVARKGGCGDGITSHHSIFLQTRPDVLTRESGEHSDVEKVKHGLVTTSTRTGGRGDGGRSVPKGPKGRDRSHLSHGEIV